MNLLNVALAEEKIQQTQSTSLPDYLAGIATYLLAFVGALFLLFIVIGALQLITAAGNPEQAKKAKKTLTYALIGFIAILLAEVILAFITGELITEIFGTGTYEIGD
jgi:amino acid transporter